MQQQSLSPFIILHLPSSSFITIDLPIVFSSVMFCTQMLSHRDAFTQRSFYTQPRFHAETFTHRSFCTEKPLHRGASTQPHFHTEAFTHRCLYREAFPQRSLYNPLHRGAFTHRNFSTEKSLHQTEASRQRTFYTEKSVRRRPFTHGRLYAKKTFHRGTLKHRHFCTALTHRSFTQRRFYAEALLTGDLTHRSFDTHKKTSFCTQTLLHREAFTQRSFYTHPFLQTEAFPHRSFYTETSLHKGAFTHIRVYTQNLLPTEVFNTEAFKSLHKEAFTTAAFTQRSFHTQKPVHREAFTQRSFTHDLVPTQKLLHTDAFTEKLFHEEPFTILYTEELLHTETSPQRSLCREELLHTRGVFNLHFGRRGCIWDFNIAILPQFLMLDAHCQTATLNSENSHFTTHVHALDATIPAEGRHARASDTQDTHDLRRGSRAHPQENSHFTTHSCVWYPRPPQRVTFRWTWPGCPCRQKREFRRTRGAEVL